MRPKADDIVLSVESAIASGELPPGSLLRQEQLAASFRVSRTPVREALKRLHAAGLVSLIPHHGARVRTLSLKDVRESFVIRTELEGLAAKLAATAMDDEQLPRLRRAEKRFARLSGELSSIASRDKPPELTVDLMAADDEFHDVILEASGSRLLIELVRSIRRPFVGPLAMSWDDEAVEMLSTTVRQHRTIRELIEARSAPGARVVMSEHITSSGALMEVLGRAEPASSDNILKRMSDPFWLRGSDDVSSRIE
jgi:DNA-binding GntR family transcriptional regulator